jgi:hypothetical protein
MRFNPTFITAVSLSIAVFAGRCSHLFAQEPPSNPQIALASLLPDAPQPQDSATPSPQQNQSDQPAQKAQTQDLLASPSLKTPPPQPKRILGVMPNYRAVSAGTHPPPFTPGEAFKVATQNSFDYSSFVFVGVTSLLAEGTNAHSQLGKGVPGYWAYYWRGYLDKTDGNYWVDFLMPTIVHQDERYYAMGEGRLTKRAVYAATRVIITPNFDGKNGFNTSEILGRGASQAISLTYYPSQTQSFSGFASKYAYAIGRDAITNVFREFWPDINARFIQRHRD